MNEKKPTKNLPAKKPGNPGGGIPWSPDQMMNKLWEASGITLERRAKALKRAFETLEQDLTAEKTEFFAFQGEVKDQRTVPDLAARSKAREQVFKLTGVDQGGTQPVKVEMNIPIPPWAKVEIKPAPADPPKPIELEGLPVRLVDSAIIPTSDSPGEEPGADRPATSAVTS